MPAHGGERMAKCFLLAPLVNGDRAANPLKTLTLCENPRAQGAEHAVRARIVLVMTGRPAVVVRQRRVGALGCPSRSRRRNIQQSPQYGPHPLTVQKPRRRDDARLGPRQCCASEFGGLSLPASFGQKAGEIIARAARATG